MKRFIQAILWPTLLIIPILATIFLQRWFTPMISFNIVYLSFAVSIYFIEKAIPFEKSWHSNDGQMWPDFLHTITSKGFVQILFVALSIMGLNEILGAKSALFMSDYTLFWQVVVGLIVAEFGLYWAHRLAHEVRAIWHFHAIHHSVSRLWFFNTGRFHFIDSLISIVFSFALMVALGFSTDMIFWISVFTAFVGILTHTNIDSQSGFLNYIFNTPELHRWHHQRNDTEGNSNYGENLMLWDLVFRSFYHDPNRRPPTGIGITDVVPNSYIDQLNYPFKRIAAGDISTKKILEAKRQQSLMETQD
jgi:sterol desaturase/sphingolipid hydroxylase (fatty acid hydroxylase superfamily)